MSEVIAPSGTGTAFHKQNIQVEASWWGKKGVRLYLTCLDHDARSVASLPVDGDFVMPAGWAIFGDPDGHLWVLCPSCASVTLKEPA